MKKERLLWLATVAVLAGALFYTNSNSDDSTKKDKDYHQYTIYENKDKDIQVKSESAPDVLDIIFSEDRTPLAGSIEDTKDSIKNNNKDYDSEIKETPVEVTALSEEKTDAPKSTETKKSSATKYYAHSNAANNTSTKATVAKSVLESVDQKALANAYATVKVAKIQAKSNVAVAVTDYAIKTIETEKTKRIKEVNDTISEVTKAEVKTAADITKSSDSIADAIKEIKRLK